MEEILKHFELNEFLVGFIYTAAYGFILLVMGWAANKAMGITRSWYSVRRNKRRGKFLSQVRRAVRSSEYLNVLKELRFIMALGGVISAVSFGIFMVTAHLTTIEGMIAGDLESTDLIVPRVYQFVAFILHVHFLLNALLVSRGIVSANMLRRKRRLLTLLKARDVKE